MDRDARATAFMAAGILGVVFTCVFSVGWGPHSAGAIQSSVQAAANAALADANLAFWQATADGQSVDLEGVAPTDKAREDAIAVVRTADGVAKVRVDRVSVIPLVSPFVWSASKQDGRVLLEGVAPSRAAANAIHEAAVRLFASDLSDEMTLASGAPAGVEWAEAAIKGLEALRRMEQGAARLAGTQLTITGTAVSEVEASQIAALVNSPTTGITATAKVSGPAEWIARADGGRIVMQGKVRSADAQRALLRAAGGDRRTEDHTSVASTGEWQSRALTALPFLAQFIMGEIGVQGRVFHISGKAPGSVLGFLREDMSEIEDNYTVDYQVSEAPPDLSEIAGLGLSATGQAEINTCEEALNRVAGGGRLVFARGGTTISRSSGEVLDKLVAVVRSCSALHVEIQGHTDNSGKRGNNLALSRERAAAVKDYLVERGLSADHLTAVGFGPDRPVASNRTDTGRARNRRIEFRVSRVELR